MDRQALYRAIYGVAHPERYILVWRLDSGEWVARGGEELPEWAHQHVAELVEKLNIKAPSP